MKTVHLSYLRLTFLAATLLFTSCYDDSYLKEQLNQYGDRLAKLEAMCQEQNNHISSLKAIVDALAQNDYVTDITPIKNHEIIIGYRILFSKSGIVEIFHGKDGTNGTNGADGYTPVIGVKKDVDNHYYWTLNGDWLLCDGKKIRANGVDGKPGQDGKPGVDGKPGQDGKPGVDGKPGQDGKPGVDGKPGQDGKPGVTPKLKIQDGMWYVSYDNGITWEPEPLGPATGATGAPGQNGDSIFSKISYDDKFVYLTLSDGVTVLTLPRHVNGQGVGPVTISLGEITSNSACFNGHINASEAELDYIQIMIRYSVPELFSAVDESLPCVIVNKPDLTPHHDFTAILADLKANTTYKYCIIVQNRDHKEYGDVLSFTTTEHITPPSGGQEGNENIPSFINNTVWTYGLSNMPAPDGWKVVDTYGYTRYGLKWEDTYGWYDCNKTDPNGEKDSKLCWAAAASNMIHWWLRCHTDQINQYGKYKGPQGYKSSTDEKIFSFFKSAFFNNGNPVHYGLNWFFTGLNQFSGDFNIPQHGITAGFLAEVLGPNKDICEYYQHPSATLLTEKIKEAFSQQKCISLVHNYAGIPHAINLWGAEFNQEGAITTLYITDNNDLELERNQAPKTPAGLLKCPVKSTNGKMYMANWKGNCNIEIQAITLLGLQTEKWNQFFASQATK